MARTVYFGFHYQRDIFRVQQVKQHYVTKGNYTAAGYFDGSLEEKAKTEGVDAVKRLIDNGLSGCTVLSVLMGKETSTRHWVYYEIFRSIEAGMGVFGIQIHKLKDPKAGADDTSSNPFAYSGYGTANQKLVPMIKYTTGWHNASNVSPIATSAAVYLKGTERPMLSSLFRIYDWIDDDGYNNFNIWAESAARQAGK
jgi:antiphage defense system Thoeris ThsB-like protein